MARYMRQIESVMTLWLSVMRYPQMHGVSTKRCGAKTRTGALCKALAMPNGRCRMHGGASLALLAHPNYRHGLYSKYSPEGMAFRAAKKRRKHMRERIRAIRKMSWGELRAETFRIFGRIPGGDWNARDFREALINNIKSLLDRERGQ